MNLTKSAAIVIFLTVSTAQAVCGQESFTYKGQELTNPQMFIRAAYTAHEVKSKSGRKSSPDALMLLQNCVRLFPNDAMCGDKFVKEYEARAKERDFLAGAERREAEKYLIPALSALVKQKPQNNYLYFARGTIYFERRQYELALADFSSNIKFSRAASAGDFCLRARTYRALNKLEFAVADYKKALILEPGDAEAVMGLIEVYLDQNKGEDAIAAATAMVEADKKMTGWLEERSRIYTALKKYDLALKDVDEMQRLKPDSADVFYSRGLIYQAQGEKEKAIVQFRRAYEILPYDVRFKEALEKASVKP